MYWDDSEDFTVRYQVYNTVEDSDECTRGEKDIEYYSSDIMYTWQSEFPFTKDEICAYKFKITNDATESDQVILFYTAGAYQSIALSLASIVALSLTMSSF